MTLAPSLQSIPATAIQRPRKHSGLLAGIRRLGGFLVWAFTGFGLLPAIVRRRGTHFKLQEIVVYSVHRSFFLWALILIGFVGAAVVRVRPGTAVLFGWAYAWVLVYTFLTLLFDVSASRFLIWTGAFTLVWIVSKYFEDLRGAHTLSLVVAHMRRLRPALEPGIASVVSWLLVLPWVCGLFYSFANGRKRFTPNEIDEWFLGEGSELTDRSGLKFCSRYRDVLETLLGFGAGDVLAVDNDQRVVKRYENVLFLMFLWPRIDEVLHQRSAVVDNAPEDPVEVENASKALAKQE
ncbi:MAG: hypothetical protein JWL69_1766 [Phycisphaerales bacterium]|nr:hypothetical protein [Phycisphaerales bacterium]